jgi:hypothetical protein
MFGGKLYVLTDFTGTTSHFLSEDGVTNRALTLMQAVDLITSFTESTIQKCSKPSLVHT